MTVEEKKPVSSRCSLPSIFFFEEFNPIKCKLIVRPAGRRNCYSIRIWERSFGVPSLKLNLAFEDKVWRQELPVRGDTLDSGDPFSCFLYWDSG